MAASAEMNTESGLLFHDREDLQGSARPSRLFDSLCDPAAMASRVTAWQERGTSSSLRITLRGARVVSKFELQEEMNVGSSVILIGTYEFYSGSNCSNWLNVKRCG